MGAVNELVRTVNASTPEPYVNENTAAIVWAQKYIRVDSFNGNVNRRRCDQRIQFTTRHNNATDKNDYWS